MELEQQGAELFFGELSFDIHDLLRRDRNGNGYISIMRLTDIQDKPKLFSTFMLSLLAEIYSQMPEKGDADKPELVISLMKRISFSTRPAKPCSTKLKQLSSL